jgi:hypothetical protein
MFSLGTTVISSCPLHFLHHSLVSSQHAKQVSSHILYLGWGFAYSTEVLIFLGLWVLALKMTSNESCLLCIPLLYCTRWYCEVIVCHFVTEL